MGIGYMASCSPVVQPPTFSLCNDEMHTLLQQSNISFRAR